MNRSHSTQIAFIDHIFGAKKFKIELTLSERFLVIETYIGKGINLGNKLRIVGSICWELTFWYDVVLMREKFHGLIYPIIICYLDLIINKGCSVSFQEMNL